MNARLRIDGFQIVARSIDGKAAGVDTIGEPSDYAAEYPAGFRFLRVGKGKRDIVQFPLAIRCLDRDEQGSEIAQLHPDSAFALECIQRYLFTGTEFAEA